jgi:hypothetical protein
MDDFIIVTSDNDMPKDVYANTKNVYLVVTKSGKTVVCKYTGYEHHGSKIRFWANAARSQEIYDNSSIAAYKLLKLPPSVINACTGVKGPNKYVDYFDALK